MQINSFIDSLIDLTYSAKKLPFGNRYLISCIDDNFETKSQEIQNKTLDLYLSLLCHISYNNFEKDENSIFLEASNTISGLISNSSLNLKKNNCIQSISNGKVEILSINGVDFVFCKNIVKPYFPKKEIIFPESIMSLNCLPNCDFSLNQFDNLTIISTKSEFYSLLSLIKGLDSKFVFISVEDHRIRTYRPFPCIVSVFIPETGFFIIDLLSIREIIADLLSNPLIIKILDDSQCLFQQFCETLGIFIYPSIDISLFKEIQRSKFIVETVVDWRVRPIIQLMSELAKKNCISIIHRYMEIRSTCIEEKVLFILNQRKFEFNYYKYTPEIRMKDFENLILKYGYLDDIGCKILSALLMWRDSVGLLENESPNFLIPGNILWKIASSKPQNKDQFKRTFTEIISPQINTYECEIIRIINKSIDEVSGKSLILTSPDFLSVGQPSCPSNPGQIQE